MYSIPPTSPYHNVTYVYVYVYDSTPDTEVVGYTAGYNGAYVANGLLMFGAGFWLGHELADDDWQVWATWRYPGEKSRSTSKDKMESRDSRGGLG